MSGEVQLTEMQQKFVTEFLKCQNASEAARRAGYKGKANVEGARLLARLSEYIKPHMPEKDNSNIMTPEEVLQALSDIARGNMGDFIDDNSMSININRAHENGKMHLIKKVKYVTKRDVHGEDETETDTVEFELYDRLKALELLGRHYAMFTDKIQTLNWKDELIADIAAKKITTHEQIVFVCADVTEDVNEIYQRLRMQGLALPASVPITVESE